MIVVEFFVVLGAIFLGARLGGIAIGFAGGLGVLVLAALGLTPGALPLDVIAIIVAVITAIAAMQIAGGMTYLVQLAERILRKNPKHLTFLAPLITYLMTLMAGTGLTAFATMPVITEVAKEHNIRPSRPLSIAVVASQIAITASPISAAVVFLSTALESKGVDYLDLLAIAIPSTFLACMATAGIMMLLDKARGTTALDTHPEYLRRRAAGTLSAPSTGLVLDVPPGSSPAAAAPVGDGAVHTAQTPVLAVVPAVQPVAASKRSVLIFLGGLVAVLGYATAISDKVGVIAEPVMTRDAAIISIMLSVATLIVVACRVPPAEILSAPTFKSGMSAASVSWASPGSAPRSSRPTRVTSPAWPATCSTTSRGCWPSFCSSPPRCCTPKPPPRRR
jgi:anaerobic C4-dicarboxylate transporter DcuA